MPTLLERFQHGWNAFFSREPTRYIQDLGYGSSYRIDRVRLTRGNERSIVTAILNRIAIDCAAINVLHVKLDSNGRYLKTLNSQLNNALTVEANIDQTGRALLLDAVLSMLDEGSVAIVPVDTTQNPFYSDGYDIGSLRVGKIIQWYPYHVRIRLYNESKGRQEEITLPKKMVAIIENPLYAVMNEPNSTLQRLIRKLNILDAIDEQSGSGKLDLIIQLPYVVRSEARKQQAELRRSEIEQQLAGSKYGIAYTDGTEHITQLNRAVENNLLKTIEYLTSMLYSQLGITQAVLDGTADDKTMLNYYNRTVEPILSAVTEEMTRKFLTKTARSQNKAIKFFRDPFRLVPVSELADIADRLTRNEILSSNEVRAIMGYKPSEDPRADLLLNKNLNHENEESASPLGEQDEENEELD